ncbi:MAG TPA: hypothetical protein PLQ83_13420, partial [Thermoflexales bacterium]|nr:hypothetical protein [Thermoflexales bacterium]HRA54659.1 hypothetical protein [Thermoflexales bacterium]
DWGAIQIDATGTANIEHAFIRYGGGCWGNTLRNESGALTMTGTTVEYGKGPGIAQNGGTLSVISSTFAHNDTGIALGTSIGAPTLDHVVFSANKTGLFVTGNYTPVLTQCSFVGNTDYGLNNNTLNLVNAVNSWWGSDTGPRHATNPTGTGDTVSDGVIFTPFLSAAP